MALLSTPNTGTDLTVGRLDLMRFDWYKIASFMLLFSYPIKNPKISSPEAFGGGIDPNLSSQTYFLHQF